MSAVTPYTIAGSEYTRNEDGVEEATLVFAVTRLTGSAPGRVIAAATASGLPRPQAPHPTRPDLRAVDFRSAPAADQPATAFVTVRYRKPSTAGGVLGAEPTVRITTETITEETVRDINGDLMQLQYVSRTVSGVGGSSVSITTQVHRVQVQRPTFSVQFERTESQNAFAAALVYSGHVNSRPWNGQPRSSWLLRIDSNDNGDGTHQVSYTAVYNPKTWLAEIRVAVNGRLPETATVGNGIEFRDVYEAADFGRLALPRLA